MNEVVEERTCRNMNMNDVVQERKCRKMNGYPGKKMPKYE